MDSVTEPIFHRIWAMPSPWTFEILPVRELVLRYVGGGKGWADPFAGHSTFAEHTNDLDPASPARNHVLAKEFAEAVPAPLNGILFDPPYSGRQVAENYRHLGRAVRADDTNAYFYYSVKRPLAPKVRTGGVAISCGWNSSGFGAKLGFELVEILLVNHGAHHNDTIVTVERKMNYQLEEFEK